MLHPGKDFEARPTTDFAKESLFNILANSYDFEELEVLDLFAGTGSIGLEFASRDSVRIDTVELSHKHSAFIQKTIQELGIKQMNLFKINAFVYLKTCTRKYDIIFADPPYEMDTVETLPDIVLQKGLLKADGIFILEHSKKISFAEHPNLSEHRSYGSVNFSFFK
jgi:16S rRNA (guanine966-N2)-methyltransferase